MGRPLNKKYFGNRNIGINGYEGVINDNNDSPPHNPAETNTFFPAGDDGIGGSSIASVTITNPGAYLDRMPTVDIRLPSLPGGVPATVSLDTVEAVSALQHNRGTGYQVGDIVRLVGGTGDAATFRVTKLRVVDIQLIDGANSQNFDGGENLVWDSTVNPHWTTPTIISNITSSGAINYDITGWASWTGGVWDGTDGAHAPTGALTLTGGSEPAQTDFTNPTYNTRGANDVNGGTGDNNGYGGSVQFTYGIQEVELVDGGSYTSVVEGQSVALTNDTPGAVGVDGELDVFYAIQDFRLIQHGSGYIDVADAAVTFSTTIDGGETQAVAEVLLKVDSGTGTGYRQGNANNQENAIIAYVWQDGERRIADIVKQTGSKRFVCITNSDGAGSGKEDETVYGYLQSHIANGPKQIDITATDANGNTYFVTKMTAHKATLVRRDQYSNSVVYNATGYIDNNMNGGNGEGETFHLVSSDTPGPINLDGAVLTWTTTPTQGSAYTTTISGDTMGSGEYGYVTYYVPNAHVYLGDHNNPVAMTMTLGGEPAEWLFETGDRVEWTFASNPDNDQVTIENA